MTKLNAPDDVTFVLVKARTVGNWFRKHIGDNEAHYRYESVVRNYLQARASEWVKEKPLMIWLELDLGTYSDNKDRKKPDLILEYSKDLWIIEVKHHYRGYKDIFDNPYKHDAVGQLREYKARIEMLGWWSEKRIHLAVFWSYNPSTIKGIELPINVESCLSWPRERNHDPI